MTFKIVENFIVSIFKSKISQIFMAYLQILNFAIREYFSSRIEFFLLLIKLNNELKEAEFFKICSSFKC
jgi:hypothetical protein